MTDPATRQLEYVRIGTTSLTGTSAPTSTVSAARWTTASPTTFGQTFGASTITAAAGTGFYLELNRNSGYSFHWVSATKHHKINGSFRQTRKGSRRR